MNRFTAAVKAVSVAFLLFCASLPSFAATRYFSDGSAIEVAADTTVADTFTMGTTGFTSNPSGTARYQTIGRIVVLSIPTLSGTSNATAFTLTGIPAAIRPDAGRNVGAVGVSNAGVGLMGTITVNSDGTATVSAGIVGTLFSALLGKSLTAVEIVYLR